MLDLADKVELICSNLKCNDTQRARIKGIIQQIYWIGWNDKLNELRAVLEIDPID